MSLMWDTVKDFNPLWEMDMPYDVRKENSKWVVYNRDTYHIYGRHATKHEAFSQLRAMYAKANPKEEK